jgi:hypothetical protein
MEASGSYLTEVLSWHLAGETEKLNENSQDS